jgi:hypothetical protein
MCGGMQGGESKEQWCFKGAFFRATENVTKDKTQTRTESGGRIGGRSIDVDRNNKPNKTEHRRL